MTTIPGLTGTSTPQPTGTSNAMAGLDQTAFLRLMTTQLTTQDPFNPVDNTQMIAQMAQFSQVAGIAEMNQSLKAIVDSLSGNRISDAASWIGRSMLVGSDIATPLRDGSYAGEIELDADADHVTVDLLDESGAVVHSIDLGRQSAGIVPFSWDGRNEAGEVAADRPLKAVVKASAAGAAIASGIATWTSIGGIQSPASGGESRLVTGLGLLPMEAAIRLA